jgi:hypothetical protein
MVLIEVGSSPPIFDGEESKEKQVSHSALFSSLHLLSPFSLSTLPSLFFPLTSIPSLVVTLQTKAEIKRWKEEMKHQHLREARTAALRQEAEETLGEEDAEVGKNNQGEGKDRKKSRKKKGCDILSLTDFLERVRDKEESRDEEDREEGREGRSEEEIYDEYLGLGIGASRRGRSSQEYRKWLQEKEKTGPSICDLLVLETIKSQKKLRKQGICFAFPLIPSFCFLPFHLSSLFELCSDTTYISFFSSARRWKKHEKNLIDKHLAQASANETSLFSTERKAGWKGGDDDTEELWSDEDDGQYSCIDLESSIR